MVLGPARVGLISYFCEDPKGRRKPINSKCETVSTQPAFRDAYRRRRGIVPVDGTFEWKAMKSQKAKQPYAIAMKDGRPEGPDPDHYLHRSAAAFALREWAVDRTLSGIDRSSGASNPPRSVQRDQQRKMAPVKHL